MTGKKHSISMTLLERLEGNHDLKVRFACPSQEEDQLFHATYNHVESEDTCVNCDKHQLIHREQRASNKPYIHYRLIASSNQVMKDSQTRDQLAQQFGILCFEMEAARLMNQLPCIVICSICNYSDSYKNKKWQGYASLTAAAYRRLLLSMVPIVFTKTNSGRSM
jgi:nucleoside phosphorylase